MNNFEFSQKLEKRLLEFAKKVADFCKKIPKDSVNYGFTSQLARSSSSIGANYIEANESLSKKDFYHRIKICRKESKETVYWFEIIGYHNPTLLEEANVLKNEAIEYLILFSSIILKLNN